MATYSNLSRLMGEHRDLLILRTFSDLSIRNLLFYQAELAHLEHELEEVEKEDQSCKDAERSCDERGSRSEQERPHRQLPGRRQLSAVSRRQDRQLEYHRDPGADPLGAGRGQRPTLQEDERRPARPPALLQLPGYCAPR